MNKLSLTKHQINELRQSHRETEYKREADRIKVVYSLGTGCSIEDVLKILMLDEKTLHDYVKHYQQGGIKKLTVDYYKSSSSKLAAEQQKNIYLIVEEIISYVEETYEVSYF